MSTTIPCPVCCVPIQSDVNRCAHCHADFSATTMGLGDSPTIIRLTAAEPLDSQALAADLVQTLTPRFQVRERLGQGGMGVVYLGRDPSLKRDVAIKVLLPEFGAEEQARARFLREAQAAAAVSHPNIVNVYESGTLVKSGSPYFVMQFIEGHALADLFPEGAHVPHSTVRRIIGEVASALEASHEAGLIHRDVKPSNIMIERHSGRAVLLDFGISALMPTHRDHEAHLTGTGVYIGTPRYTSPEQASGEALTAATDVYSLGCVAYELLAGRPIFPERTPLALMAAHIKDTPAPVRSFAPDVTEAFATLVSSMLAKGPDKRPNAHAVRRFLLPDRTLDIEWPPQGLEAAHGVLARPVPFFVAAGLSAATAVLIALSAGGGFDYLALTPLDTDVGFAQSLIREVVPQDSLATLIGTLILSISAASCLFGTVLALRGLGTVLRISLSGKSLQDLVDVGCDSHSDTAYLLNRVGRFALLTESQSAALDNGRKSFVKEVWWATIALGVTMAVLLAGFPWVQGGSAFMWPWAFPVVLMAALTARAIGIHWREARLTGERWQVPRIHLSPARPGAMPFAWLANKALWRRVPVLLRTIPFMLGSFGALMVALSTACVIAASILASRRNQAHDALALRRLIAVTDSSASLRANAWPAMAEVFDQQLLHRDTSVSNDTALALLTCRLASRNSSCDRFVPEADWMWSIKRSGQPRIATQPLDAQKGIAALTNSQFTLARTRVHVLANADLAIVFSRLDQLLPPSPTVLGTDHWNYLTSLTTIAYVDGLRAVESGNTASAVSAGTDLLRLGFEASKSGNQLITARARRITELGIALGRALASDPSGREFQLAAATVDARMATLDKLVALYDASPQAGLPFGLAGAIVALVKEPSLLDSLTHDPRTPPMVLAALPYAALTAECHSARAILIGPSKAALDRISVVDRRLSSIPFRRSLTQSVLEEAKLWQSIPQGVSEMWTTMYASVGARVVRAPPRALGYGALGRYHLCATVRAMAE